MIRPSAPELFSGAEDFLDEDIPSTVRGFAQKVPHYEASPESRESERASGTHPVSKRQVRRGQGEESVVPSRRVILKAQ